ncbi:MAG: hypothetical protein ACFFCK_04000 [Promethearchaeota archaeon]
MEENHEEHMYVFVRHNGVGKIIEHAKGAKWICDHCGRVANKPEYLCSPTSVDI